MIVTPTFMKNFRSLLERLQPKAGAVYRFEGMGELWFSVDKEVGDRLFEGGQTYYFTFVYSLEVSGTTYHFFNRYPREKVPDA